MNIEDIIANKQRLDKELQIALSTMEKKDTIKTIDFDCVGDCDCNLTL